jgi:hypothetical protein
MTRERDEFARKKKYPSRLAMALDRYKIPKKDYDRFVSNVDEVIDVCNEKLGPARNSPRWFYSEFNVPCYMCELPEFPFDSLEDAFDHFVSRRETLGRFRKKIRFGLVNGRSETRYDHGSDSFEIMIDFGNNIRHRATDLIHELGHVAAYLESFEKGVDPTEEGDYAREKRAIEEERGILKEASTDLYEAYFYNETLLLLRRALFEAEVNENPASDLGRLYASVTNRCYKKANQTLNPLFFLDLDAVYRPFSTLPHAVAQTNVLLDSKGAGRYRQ